ncbi:hypothetical protein N780_07370 [Pontibacillus chungwhensis BH030062]|uniref:Uncharacterized protein n=3 Tax=Pontibacillus TaxID=289201 RepID=A0A0A2UU52_9BACI|nr:MULTISPECIES: hypothetical protein [Pontibacillus]KGP90036.1 hypothetical protein N780_07370 [Pontibacillus chungwhensis BH030062]MCD5324958.1 hypothetical protein [Pontibacillus sp. HN14]QST00717.1 hypothetical protein IMZ31_03845 [Pontibacillus sp. ALD_SL1]WIF98916.1 hypothetical protein QNI29_04465 [Pontibacillus chungwhensis]GGD23874.1 hypothetical protein GCM10011389_34520 [Pontibacillus salipaludis]
MSVFFVPFALFILFVFNSLTHSLCLKTEMAVEKQPKVFRTINILITILLISSYVEILYT